MVVRSTIRPSELSVMAVAPVALAITPRPGSETCGDTGAPVVAKEGEPGGGVANRAAGHEALTGTRTVKGECWTGTAKDSDGCNGHNQCVRPREVATHEFGIVLESFIPHSGDKALDEVERSVAGHGQAEQRGDGTRAHSFNISEVLDYCFPPNFLR